MAGDSDSLPAEQMEAEFAALALDGVDGGFLGDFLPATRRETGYEL